MAHAAFTQPTRVWRDPFQERTARGLFCAPWLGTPTDEGISAVELLSETLMQTPTRPDDLSVILGHLLAVNGHCQRAAQARDPRICTRHYGDALRECATALSRLQSSKGGTPTALAAWTGGTHTLIRAQMAMVSDPPGARVLAYEALHQLSSIDDPVCCGAEADALSAMLLVREPTELESYLQGLPDEVRGLVGRLEAEVDCKQGELNNALAGVHRNHEAALGWVLGWGVLNLLLMATGPINSYDATAVPWSAPFLLGLLVLWYFTWARPFRNGLTFFAHVRSLRWTAIADFRAAASALPNPMQRFGEAIMPVLEKARHQQDRLTTFYLYQLPVEFDTYWKAKATADGARERLDGDWMADLIDAHPWRLVETLTAEPSLIPRITRVWYGSSAH